MNITRANYEGFLLDLAEGNLSEKLENELYVFLAQNPDLDVPEYELPTISSSDRLDSSYKDSLKRSLPTSAKQHGYDTELLIALLEGDLEAAKAEELKKRLKQSEELAKEWKLIQLTKVARSNIHFPNKAALKRKKRGLLIPIFRAVSIAASLLLLVGTFWYFQGSDSTEIAESSEVKIESAPTLPDAKEAENLLVSEDRASDELEEQNTSDGVKATFVNTKQSAGQNPVTNRTGPSAEPRPKSREQRNLLAVLRNHEHYDPPVARLLQGDAKPSNSDFPIASIAAEETENSYTVSEYVAHVFRGELLKQPDGPKENLDGNDVLSLVERGVANLSSKEANITLTKTAERKRFGLRLGKVGFEVNLSD